MDWQWQHGMFKSLEAYITTSKHDIACLRRNKCLQQLLVTCSSFFVPWHCRGASGICLSRPGIWHSFVLTGIDNSPLRDEDRRLPQVRSSWEAGPPAEKPRASSSISEVETALFFTSLHLSTRSINETTFMPFVSKIAWQTQVFIFVEVSQIPPFAYETALDGLNPFSSLLTKPCFREEWEDEVAWGPGWDANKLWFGCQCKSFEGSIEPAIHHSRGSPQQSRGFSASLNFFHLWENLCDRLICRQASWATDQTPCFWEFTQQFDPALTCSSQAQKFLMFCLEWLESLIEICLNECMSTATVMGANNLDVKIVQLYNCMQAVSSLYKNCNMACITYVVPKVQQDNLVTLFQNCVHCYEARMTSHSCSGSVVNCIRP